MARRDNVRSVHSVYINRVFTGILHIRKNTQKSKFLLTQAFKWKKIMFFVIPEIASKTFVMLYKKLPDHFNATLSHCFNIHKETLSIKQRQEDKIQTFITEVISSHNMTNSFI